MDRPIIDPEVKREFPDEVLDRILKVTDELVDKIPISVLAMIPSENRIDFVSILANTMIIGASIALECMNQKKENNG